MLKYLLLIIVILILVVIIRTFKHQTNDENIKIIKEDFDETKAIKSLQELIKCKTISYDDRKLEDEKEFKKLLDLTKKLYPNVYKKAKVKTFKGRGLLFHIKGKSKDKPAVFMSHYDVVPVEESSWSKPAFKGLVEKGIMWGRGTLDTKNTFNGVLFAAETLLSDGFVPKNDIYLAFSGSEEISGDGAVEIVNYFKTKGIKPEFVIDEGGAVVKDIFPGVSKPCGLVGLAEKGCVDIRLTAKSNGGHSSAPKPNSPIDELSKACIKINKHPFKAQFNGPSKYMFKELSMRSTFLFRMIFANMWLFKPIINMYCEKSGGQINAMLRTTTAFTQMQGSVASNVIPAKASMVINVRIAPGDSIDSVVEHFKKVINNPNIEIEAFNGSEPSSVSRVDTQNYQLIKNAIEETWGCIVSPYLMIQASDSRHYSGLCDQVYRFSAEDLDDNQFDSIHGNDEHIKLSTIKKAVSFFIKVMRQC